MGVGVLVLLLLIIGIGSALAHLNISSLCRRHSWRKRVSVFSGNAADQANATQPAPGATSAEQTARQYVARIPFYADLLQRRRRDSRLWS